MWCNIEPLQQIELSFYSSVISKAEEMVELMTTMVKELGRGSLRVAILDKDVMFAMDRSALQ
jgi:hypothetical protein